MERVVVLQCGLIHMQVCAEEDATDSEILIAANGKVPCGTTNGWCAVDRTVGTPMSPVRCQDHPSRMHYIVSC